MTVVMSPSIRYLIQKNHFSFHNKFIITDDSGVIHYKVTEKFLALNNKFLISNADGNQLITIHQDLNFRPTYKLFSIAVGISEQIAIVKTIGPIWQRKFEINSVNGEYIMQKKEDGSANEFTLTKNGHIIAITAKDVSPIDSFYWADIFYGSEEDHAFALALVIILCCTHHSPIYSVTKSDIEKSKK